MLSTFRSARCNHNLHPFWTRKPSRGTIACLREYVTVRVCNWPWSVSALLFIWECFTLGHRRQILLANPRKTSAITSSYMHALQVALNKWREIKETPIIAQPVLVFSCNHKLISICVLNVTDSRNLAQVHPNWQVPSFKPTAGKNGLLIRVCAQVVPSNKTTLLKQLAHLLTHHIN